MSQQELADKAGMTRDLLSKIEMDQRNLKADYLKDLCEALCISADTILGLNTFFDDITVVSRKRTRKIIKRLHEIETILEEGLKKEIES